jgi:CRP/FNR family cyclic AMP-dependent transcriptional regulator
VETPNRVHQHPMDLDAAAAVEKILAALPVRTYFAGETVFKGGLKTGRLLILKRGAVAILKDSIELARVGHPGAVFGEISALLDQPHAADVRVVEDSEFYVAEAALLEKDPIALLHVARILAQRLVAADIGLVELRKQLPAGPPSGAIKRVIEKLEEVLNVRSSRSNLYPDF